MIQLGLVRIRELSIPQGLASIHTDGNHGISDGTTETRRFKIDYLDCTQSSDGTIHRKKLRSFWRQGSYSCIGK